MIKYKLSVGEKLYEYECKSCGFTKWVPKFLIEGFIQDSISETGAIGLLEEATKLCQN